MSDELVRFLNARFDEDEGISRRAASYDDGASHDVQGPVGTWTCLDESEWFGASYRGGVIAPRIGYANAPELGEHIVEWGPARVLREIDAKRQLLAEHQDVNDSSCGTCVDGQWGYPTHGGSTPQRYPCRTLRLLALPYANHPDYRAEWRAGEDRS